MIDGENAGVRTMRSILEVAEILGLDDQQFHERIDEGRLDGGCGS
jgi:hypothetical protein